MISKEKLLEHLEIIAPTEFAADWDNCGFQIEVENSYKKILVALDITEAVVKEAVDAGIDLIVSHHPLIFGNFNRIEDKKWIELINNKISVYSAHTNFDAAPGGNNDYILKLLDFSSTEHDSDTGSKFYRVAKLKKEMAMNEIIKKTLFRLNVNKNQIKIVGDVSNLVKKVLISCGSGGDFIEDAASKGCQLMITGEMNHHSALLAKELGVSVIELGHYQSEKTFNENMTKQLKTVLPEGIFVIPSKVDTDPYLYV